MTDFFAYYTVEVCWNGKTVNVSIPDRDCIEDALLGLLGPNLRIWTGEAWITVPNDSWDKGVIYRQTDWTCSYACLEVAKDVDGWLKVRPMEDNQ